MSLATPSSRRHLDGVPHHTLHLTDMYLTREAAASITGRSRGRILHCQRHYYPGGGPLMALGPGRRRGDVWPHLDVGDRRGDGHVVH